MNISAFPFTISQLNLLNQKGFRTIDELRRLSVSELSEELSVSAEEAMALLYVAGTDVNSQKAIEGTLVSTLLNEKPPQSIITFNQQIDSKLLPDGIPVGKITEISSLPGIGKTQFAMQLAVDVTIPEAFGGLGGSAIFIDTEGSFHVERIAQIAGACVSHTTMDTTNNSTPTKQTASQLYTLDSILSKIHYYRCKSLAELMALAHMLPTLISTFRSANENVRLVVVDNIAAHLRHLDELSLRSKLIHTIGKRLQTVAENQQVAVLCTNQMIQKQQSSQPALGDSWAAYPSIRLELFWHDNHRAAKLLKSSFSGKSDEVSSFVVNSDGIR